MRIAIISDIHANLEAFEAVLRKICKSNVDEVWCLGDIVGYGADPLICVQLTQENCSLVVKGNHDAGVAHQGARTNFSGFAAYVLDWTRARLDENSLRWLDALPLRAVRHDFLAFHSSLAGRNAYIFSHEDIANNFMLMQKQYPNIKGGFFGHTHTPCFYQPSNPLQISREAQVVQIRTDEPFLCNPSSVGQPRNHSPKAWFAIWDSGAHTLSFITASYEIGTAQRKILDAGLPTFLAERLEQGI
jgi:diadenosine tetraphosphatase ApaH/serine/threonine PP2A family protein phosphatase